MNPHLRMALSMAFACGIAGCGEPGGGVVPPRPDRPLSAPQFLHEGKSTRGFGENCAEHGPSDCTSGVCVRTNVDPFDAAAYRCSRKCANPWQAAKQRVQCPDGWVCAEVEPGSGESYCWPAPVAIGP